MRYRGSRIPLLLTYLTVTSLCLGLLLAGAWPSGQEAVTVMAPLRQPAEGRWIHLLMTWGSPALFWWDLRGDGRAGHLGLGQEIQTGERWAIRFLQFVSGLEWSSPRSLMSMALPSLFGRATGLPQIASPLPVVQLNPPSRPEPRPDLGEEMGPWDPPAPDPHQGGESWSGSENPLVIIYHTHTQESFLPEMGLGPGIPAERAFSMRPEINMLAVGEMLARELAGEHGIGVIHVQEYFDLDETRSMMQRLGAYSRAAPYIEDLTERYPGAYLLLDLHRDAPRRDRTTLETEEGDYARILLVVGSDQRLTHPNWRDNLALAQALSDNLESLVPGISRGLEISVHRYNQHLSRAALLVELGGVDNTLDEVERSVKVLARALSNIILMEEVPQIRIPSPQD